MARKILSVKETAAEKNCSVQAIHDALNRGALSGGKLGALRFVEADADLKAWAPNPVRQQVGRDSQAGRKK